MPRKHKDEVEPYRTAGEIWSANNGASLRYIGYVRTQHGIVGVTAFLIAAKSRYDSTRFEITTGKQVHRRKFDEFLSRNCIVVEAKKFAKQVGRADG
jgi:hypothetical protein